MHGHSMLLLPAHIQFATKAGPSEISVIPAARYVRLTGRDRRSVIDFPDSARVSRAGRDFLAFQ